MKKRLVVLILIIILISSSAILLYFEKLKLDKDALTGETITGEATSGTSSVNITLVGSPSLNLIQPENETYFTDTNLNLTFTAGSASSIWYNLDNGANTTISENTQFNTTSGQHTLNLYANNSDNINISRNVTFTVDTSIIRISYNNFTNTSTKGSSTDFNKSSYEDIQSLSNIILEINDSGKIEFNTAINVTNDSDFSDDVVDLDSNVNISSNRIELNSTALPNFNVSATLSLYGLSFTDPRVLRDGSVCSSSICTEVSYSGGVFIFNVTQFTVYTAEETPSGDTGGGGGGGGAGGVVTEEIKDFELEPEELSIKLKQGEVKTTNFTIKNNLNSQLNIDITSENLEEFLTIREQQFILGPGESKLIILDVVARPDDVPNLYVGKLIISSADLVEELLTLIEIESSGVLLEVFTEIAPSNKRISPGEELLAEVTLVNLGESRTDVAIEYQIISEDGIELLREQETIGIETQTNLIKRFRIPENAAFGKYILYVKVTYDEKIASATSTFEVREGLTFSIAIVWVILISLALAAIVTGVVLHLREKSNQKN